MVHGQGHSRHTEHHHREEARHEHTCRGVARKEAIEVASSHCSSHGIGILTEHEPNKAVEDMVQPHRNQQAVEHTIDKGSQSTGADNPFAYSMDNRLTGAPNNTENRG